MKQFTLSLLICCSTFAAVSAQTVVAAEDQGVVLRFILELGVPISLDYDVQNYKITYTTTDPFGQPDTATGLLTLPVQDELVSPLVVYNHGTVAGPDLVPSVEGVLERFIPQGFAGRGFIGVAPDYLGLGDSDGIHPYLHAATQASAGRDMVVAVRAWLDEQGVTYNDQVFVTGYSQGGHASASFQRAVEAEADAPFAVSAAAHLSAPFDVAEPSPALLGLPNADPRLLSFFLNTAISYNFAYDLYGGLDGLFNEPYLTEARRFVNGEQDLYEMGNAVSDSLTARNDIIGSIFSDAFVTDVLDEDPTLFNAYNENDVFDFTPQAPTLIYYCNGDMTVAPSNSLLAAETYTANGIDSLLLIDGGDLDHGSCAIPAAVAALEFFEGLANFFPVSTEQVVSRPDVVLSPNPSGSGANPRLTGVGAQPHPYLVYDFSGRTVLRGTTDAAGTIDLRGRLLAGNYLLRVQLPDGNYVVRKLTRL